MKRGHQVCQYCAKPSCGRSTICRDAFQNRREARVKGAVRSEGRKGRSYMSKGERACGEEYLEPLQLAGEIRDLEFQVSVLMTKARIRWVLDFKYFDCKLGETVFADFKGHETERWKLLKKLWPHYGPARLRVFMGEGSRMRIVEEIIPKNGDGPDELVENT